MFFIYKFIFYVASYIDIGPIQTGFLMAFLPRLRLNRNRDSCSKRETETEKNRNPEDSYTGIGNLDKMVIDN